MFTLAAKIEDNTQRIKDAAGKAAFRNFGHAAASIRKDAQASITKATEVTKATFSRAGGKRRMVSRAHHAPSPPGSPPLTTKGLLPRAILFSADKDGAVVGPAASIAGMVGQAHEFGGDYKGATYPERPFMFPALERAIPRFAGDWEGSIGE
jgi:hypothetical protein